MPKLTSAQTIAGSSIESAIQSAWDIRDGVLSKQEPRPTSREALAILNAYKPGFSWLTGQEYSRTREQHIASGAPDKGSYDDSHIACPSVNSPGPEYEGCEQQCCGDNHAMNCRFSHEQLLRYDEEAMAALRLLKQKGYSVETICAAIASL